jgi:hypothetical protein
VHLEIRFQQGFWYADFGNNLRTLDLANRVRATALSLLQLRVLRLGFLQDGDVRVGVLTRQGFRAIAIQGA